MKRGMVISGLLLALFVSGSALAGGRIVSNPSQFPAAASEACDGQYVGADCTVEIAGGYLAFGTCQNNPNASGELTCQIESTTLPENCQNNALGTKGSLITFGGLAGFLFFMRRRRS